MQHRCEIVEMTLASFQLQQQHKGLFRNRGVVLAIESREEKKRRAIACSNRN